MQHYNIYCDESSYTNPLQQYFLIGAVIIPRDQKDFIQDRLKKVRRKFGFMPELKWQNVTDAKLPYLNELLQVFFTSEISFRTIIVDKSKLNLYKGRHVAELSFYKFYYLLLRGAFQTSSRYYLFLDVKNNSEATRLGDLRRYLENSLQKLNSSSNYSQNQINDRESKDVESANYIAQLQEVDSQESLFIQLTDLLMGAVGYYWNGLRGSPAKMKFINNLTTRLQKTNLQFSSQLYDKKWNQFVWEPSRE